jgi:L-lactate dehydrogenase (cytochrome)
MRPARAVNIEDLRSMARKRVPRAVFEYLDGGAEGECTLRENLRAFQEVTFRPRGAVETKSCDTRVQVLGHELAFPALLAPVGYTRLLHPGGEMAAARAAGDSGTVFVLSTVSGHSLEKVKAASRGPVWYQLYLVGGREAAEGAIERARRAGLSALVITLDTAVIGMRERDLRNGVRELLARRPLPMLPFLPNVLAHPRWMAGFLFDGGVPNLENVVIPGEGPMRLSGIGGALSRSAITWDDMAWIRKLWAGPIVMKGILTADDARRAVDEGASAIVVSNHGGRQLDGTEASLRALPEIVAAVGDRTEVLMDGGIRRGSDMVKALCLGARAVLIGRAYSYGLAAAGYDGVMRAIQILKDDVERTLRLLGCESAGKLDGSFLNGD